MDLGHLVIIAIDTIFVTNIVFAKFLGICPYLGVSRRVDTALGMGMAVIFVMTLSNAITYLVLKFLLKPFELEYLQTIAFILIIAALVQFLEIFMKKQLYSLYQALGIYLPLITTNCAILGVAILAIQKDYNFLTSIVYSIATGTGYTLAIVLFASMRERLEYASLPESFQGMPIALVTAAIVSMAFMGFSGLVKL